MAKSEPKVHYARGPKARDGLQPLYCSPPWIPEVKSVRLSIGKVTCISCLIVCRAGHKKRLKQNNWPYPIHAHPFQMALTRQIERLKAERKQSS